MSILKQTINAELIELIHISTQYAEQIDNAKTNTKRQMIKKRLRKNNEKIAELIVALEKLNKKEMDDVEDDSEGRTEKASTTKEPSS